MKKVLITIIAISTLIGHVRAQHYENNDIKVTAFGSETQSLFQLSSKSKSNKFVIHYADLKKFQVEIWHEIQKNKDSLTYSTQWTFDVKKSSYKLDIATDMKSNGYLLYVIARPGGRTSALTQPKDGCQIKYHVFNLSESTEKSRVPLILIYHVKINDTTTEKAVNEFLKSTNLKSNDEEAITKKILSITGDKVELLTYSIQPMEK
jgi:hypothetical protein